MKRISILIILAFVVVLSSCKDDDVPSGPNAKERAFEVLAGNWDLGNGAGRIEVDGTDVSANYPGFSLSFTDGGYTTTNGADLFNANGTWEWGDDEAKTIKVDDGKEVTIVLLNANRFTFTFNHSGTNSAAGIAGNYTVSVVK